MHPSIRKIKEKKRKEILNNDLAVLPSHDTPRESLENRMRLLEE